jgi:TonB family protein
MRLNTFVAAATAAFITLATAPVRAEGNAVDTVRELYASAAYEDALTLVDELLSSNKTPAERQAMGLYRVLCLVALARGPEADRAIEVLIAQEPLYRPPTDDMPPRVRAAFAEARKRILPSIVQQQYQHAKTAFDNQDFVTAAGGFERVLEMLKDPDLAATTNQPPLSDLKTLASGFHQLSAKAAAPPPPPPPPVEPAPAPVPLRDFRKVYTATDTEVVPPTVVRQVFPPFPGKVTTAVTAVVIVTIDATGAVESATVRAPISDQYDRFIVAAAKKWQYRPATVDGVPVRFLKVVQVNLTPSGR